MMPKVRSMDLSVGSVTVRELGDFFIWLGLVVGSIATIAGILRIFVVNPLKRSAMKELDTLKQSTATILAEVAPENGIRMGERLNALDMRLIAVEQRVSDHVLTVAALSRDSSAR